MSFRINFFPIPYILALILLVSFVTVFNETVYLYLSSNFIINGSICVLFAFCTIWILGSLSYFSRSARLFTKILRSVGPIIDKRSIKSDGKSKDIIVKKSMILKSSSPIAGTLFDSPIVSSMLAKMERKNKLEVSKVDAEEIAQTIVDNASRVLAPSRFIASIFILCGLVGTFLGLLGTIGGVAKALAKLSEGGLTNDISGFIKLLSDPLQGMSTAFSASLFGLTAALMSNFGNYLAWERLLVFANKVKNYLLANTGVFDEDPARITARDLLISLEESFDTLYKGLTDRLENLTKHIASMSSVIVKTHERQEKMLKVILKDHDLMEQFWRKFLLGTEGVKMIINEMSKNLAVVLPEAMRKVFAPVLEVMIEIMDKNSTMIDRSVKTSEDILSVQKNNLAMSEEVISAISNNSSLTDRANGILLSIKESLNLDHLAGLIHQGNEMKDQIRNLFVDSNEISAKISEISIDANNISENISRKIEDNIVAINSVVSAIDNSNLMSEKNIELSEISNAIAVDIKASIDENNKMTELALQEMVTSNEIANGKLVILKDNNVIGSNIVELINSGNKMTEDILSQVSIGNSLSNEILISNTNCVNIFDERLAMIIGFSRDLLINAENLFVSFVEFKNQISSYYDSLNLSEKMNNNLQVSENILSILSNSYSSIDNIAVSSSKMLDYLDHHSKIETEILNNTLSTNNQLIDIKESLFGFFDESSNFKTLYVDIEKQINNLLNSFNRFEGNFESFSTKVSEENSITFNNFNETTGEVISRLSNLGELLSNLINSFDKLGGISIEHKDLTNMIYGSVISVLDQEKILNDNISKLSLFIDEGFNKFISSISSVGNVSFEFAKRVNLMLESIVSSVNQLPTVNDNFNKNLLLANDKIDKLIKKQDENVVAINKTNDILLNSDLNVSGIGNIVSANSSSIDKLSNKFELIVEKISKAVEEQSKFFEDFNKTGFNFQDISTSIKDGALSLKNLFEVLSNSMNNIEKSLESLNSVSNSMNMLSYNNQGIKDTGMKIQVFKDEISDLILMQKQSYKEVVSSFNPLINNLSGSLEQINQRLVSLSDFVNVSKAFYNSYFDKVGINNSEIIQKYNDVYKIIEDFSSKINPLVNYIGDIAKDISNQKDFMSKISSDVLNLSNTSREIKDIGGLLLEIKNTLYSLFNKVGSSDKTLLDAANNVNVSIRNISLVIDKLTNELNHDKEKSSYVNNDLSNSLSQILNEIVNLNNLLNQSVNSNDISSVLFGVNANLEDIKTTISNLLNYRLNKEISKISNNQQEIALKLGKIIPYLEDVTRSLKNSDNKNINQGIINVVKLLEDLKNTDINNNVKLELLLKAVDALTSEMLNSRGVSESILNIVAELGGFKKIK